jgi:hypothetical protein
MGREVHPLRVTEVVRDLQAQLAAGLFNPDAGSALDLTEADIDDWFALT